MPPVPGLGFLLESYSGRLRALAIVWFVFAGLTLLLGFALPALAMHWFTANRFGPWTQGATPPPWLWFLPLLVRFAWAIALGRAALAVAAGWGLMEHARWGRVVAIIAAILNSIHLFPLGLALGIWTLVVLLGYRNATLYEQLPRRV